MSVARKIGYWAGRHWIISIVAVLALLVWLGSGSPKRTDSAPPSMPGSDPLTPAQVATRRAAVDECKASIEVRKATYTARVSEGNFVAARAALLPCPSVLHDPALMAMQNDIVRLETVAVARDTKAPARDRLTAIASLRAGFPAEADKLEPQRATLQAQVDKIDAAERAKSEATAAAAERKARLADAARRKKEGVLIGMSPADVYASSWGHPSKVNRTTTAGGTREQWVYESGSYLYFTNSVLTTIQN